MGLKSCTRLGLDVTWRCQWRCTHCFYRRKAELGSDWDLPLADAEQRTMAAQRAGYDHVVLTGFGEPTLWPAVLQFVLWCREQGMAVSTITNAATGLHVLQNLYECGLDHAHVRAHAASHELNGIARHNKAWERQREVFDWLAAARKPYRVNIALQQANRESMASTAQYHVEHGVYHVALLGFLPHYEWHDEAEARTRIRAVAVHPAELRPVIERAAQVVLDAGKLLTIRYQPLCHLDPAFWPYVTNARYVYFDPWEWNYTGNVSDMRALWADACSLGDSVACDEPCGKCAARRHCGGWNRHYARAYDGADLRAIVRAPAQYAETWERDGGLFDQNPANALTGTIGPCRTAAEPPTSERATRTVEV